VDKTPPAVVESVPESGATGVSVTAPLRLVFSEKLDKRSFERGLWVNPRVRWAKQSWSGAEVSLVPLDSLLADSTYVISLGTTVQDRRSNQMGIPVTIGFSTGPRLDQSALVGTVFRSGKPAVGAGVWLYVWDEEREIDPEVDIPYRQTATDREGNFILPFLRPAVRSYEVFAFLDQNKTGAYEEGDPSGYFPEPVTVTAHPDTTGGVEVDLWDAKRSGTIVGRIEGRWETGLPLILEATAAGDSAAARTIRIGEPGPFRMSGIPAGSYILGAYQDLNGDELWSVGEDLQEPGVTVPDTVVVEAGVLTRGIEILRVPEDE
jgi:hypothetical protein